MKDTKEYLKDPSPIHHHSNLTGNPTNHNNFQIIGREGQDLARNAKESIFIRVNNPTLNNKIGKFNLPHMWDRVLLNMPGLNLKRHVQTNGYVNNNNYSNTLPSNNPNCPQSFNNVHFPSHILGGSEHVHRTS